MSFFRFFFLHQFIITVIGRVIIGYMYCDYASKVQGKLWKVMEKSLNFSGQSWKSSWNLFAEKCSNPGLIFEIFLNSVPPSRNLLPSPCHFWFFFLSFYSLFVATVKPRANLTLDGKSTLVWPALERLPSWIVNLNKLGGHKIF